jgi:hypothetical protein
MTGTELEIVTPAATEVLGRRPKNHQRLCACPTWREQRAVFEDEVLGLSPTCTRDLSRRPTAAQQFRLLYKQLLPWRHASPHACS